MKFYSPHFLPSITFVIVVIYMIFIAIRNWCKPPRKEDEVDEGLVPYFQALDDVDRSMMINTE
jgi:hypothetical protein